MDDIRDRLKGGRGSYYPTRGKRASSTPRNYGATSQNRQLPTESNRQTNILRETIPAVKRKSYKWVIVTILLAIILTGLGAGLLLYISRGQSTRQAQSPGVPAPADSLPTEQVQAPKSIRLLATGDMIAHDTINENAQNDEGSYDYLNLMSPMKQFFDKSDIAFCNQSTPAGGETFGISGYPVFNAPIEFARGIEAVGCNLINIGTNHSNDKGQDLINATVAAWDNRPNILAVAGANRSVEEQQKPRIFSSKGLKFGFLSYSTYTNKPVTNSFGLNMYNEAKAKADLAALRTHVDFVIVSMRWGTEYSPDVNVQQDQIAQVLADNGADVVLGHGPHVVEPVKRLTTANGNETLIWYSLGNFLNSQLDIETLIGGFAVMDIDISSKKVTDIGFMPVYQHYEWTPEQAARKSASDLTARHNFTMVPLDQAAELLAKSHHNTTVEAETSRIQQILNKFSEVPIIKSTEF